MSTRTSDSIELSVMKVLCKRFRSEYAKELINHDPSFVLGTDIKVDSYTESASFSKDYLLYSFLRKWKGWSLSIDPESEAFGSWTRAERQCFETNRRFPHEIPKWAFPLISRVQRKIISVIGLSPCFEEIDSLCRWSKGATFDHRRGTPLAQKMSDAVSVTPRALEHLVRVQDGLWLSASKGYSVVRGNRMVMVPKTSKTHRPIAAEPTGNAFLQQGVGRFIKKRLKSRCGIDLFDQSINQRFAFSALVENLSTIDLSMASDTLARNVVHVLLPPEWSEYLEDLRSPITRYKGKEYVNNKFSSMGNAYTFELESLIFYAIVHSVVSEENFQRLDYVSVFGDDIIVPAESYDSVVSALSFFGFSVNTEKSYKEGKFYESCGKQYFDLEDVTPIFQKEIVGKSLPELIRLHNRLYRWGVRNGLHLVRDALNLVLKFTRKHHPKLKKLPEQPLCEMDVGFISDSCRRNKNGDFILDSALTSIPQSLWYAQANDIACAYAYKLRNPKYKNAELDGSCSYIYGERTVLRKTVVWNSTVAAYVA